jgi:hypothetical protein
MGENLLAMLSIWCNSSFVKNWGDIEIDDTMIYKAKFGIPRAGLYEGAIDSAYEFEPSAWFDGTFGLILLRIRTVDAQKSFHGQ